MAASKAPPSTLSCVGGALYLLVVLIGRLGRRGTGLVGEVLNEVPVPGSGWA